MGVAVDGSSSQGAAFASAARTIIIFVTIITTATQNLGTSLSLAGARAIHSSLHALLLRFNHDKLGNNFRHLWRQQRAPQSPRQSHAAFISAAVSKSLCAGHHISITEMRVTYGATPERFP